MKPFSLALLLLLTTGTGAVQAADPHLARNLAATCANCHGTDGRGNLGSNMEPLFGMPKEKILLKLDDFRAGNNKPTIMHQIARGYSEKQLELIAGYFASRPQHRQEP